MAASEYKDLGIVKAIGIYPVKSMGGEFLEASKVGFAGLGHDREFAFLRINDTTGLPWLSARQCPDLLTYKAVVENIGDRAARVIVRMPSGDVAEVQDPRLVAEIEEVAGEPLRLVRLWRRAYDSAGADVSVITTQSINAIAELAGRPLEFARFRPNVVIEAESPLAFREEKWVGSSVAIGNGTDAPRFRLTRKDPRCRIVSLDPETGDEDSAVHKAIVSARKNNLGAYATVERTGEIVIGAAVRQRQ